MHELRVDSRFTCLMMFSPMKKLALVMTYELTVTIGFGQVWVAEIA